MPVLSLSSPQESCLPPLVGGEGFFRWGCSSSFLGPAWWHDSLSWCFRCKTRFVAVLFPLEVALVSGRALGGLLLLPFSSSVTPP